MTVIDASVWLSVVAGEIGPEALPDDDTWVPAHFDAEVLSGLRGLVRGHRLSAEAGSGWSEALRAAPFVRAPLRELPASWPLSAAVSAYDAPYVALAARERTVLLTCDARLARGVGDRCDVRLLAS